MTTTINHFEAVQLQAEDVIDENRITLRHFPLDPSVDYQRLERDIVRGFVCPRKTETSQWWAVQDLNL